MFDFLENIVDFFSIIGSMIITFFTNVIEIVKLLFKGFVYLSTAIGFLPTQYQVTLLAIVSLGLIVTILNFGGQ